MWVFFLLFLIFIMRNNNRGVSEQRPGVWDFLGHFALKSIFCCDGGFRSFLHLCPFPRVRSTGCCRTGALRTSSDGHGLSVGMAVGGGLYRNRARCSSLRTRLSMTFSCSRFKKQQRVARGISQLPWVLAGSVHPGMGQSQPCSLNLCG